jgi:hypothetical protein
MKIVKFGILVILVVMGTNHGSAQSINPIPITVNVSATPLAVIPGDIELDELQAGTTYTVVPDGSGSLALTPNDGFATVSSSTETNIVGDINAKILVTFILPTRLFPNSSGGTGVILASFSNTSAAWGASGAENNYFDPRSSIVMQLDASGNIFFSLGGIFEVPPTTETDTFIGEALITAQYTGL